MACAASRRFEPFQIVHALRSCLKARSSPQGVEYRADARSHGLHDRRGQFLGELRQFVSGGAPSTSPAASTISTNGPSTLMRLIGPSARRRLVG
jgi:hypothetical protein